MSELSTQQISDWRRDGFLHPFPMLDEVERQECLAGLARYETWLGAPVSSSSNLNCRTMPDLILPWAAWIARDDICKCSTTVDPKLPFTFING